MTNAKANDAGGRGEQILLQILEEAIDAGAEAVEMEFDSSGHLQVCFMAGNSGIGHVLGDRKQIRELVDAVVQLKKRQRSPGRTVKLDLCGVQHTVSVQRYDHFGESAYRLLLDKPGSVVRHHR